MAHVSETALQSAIVKAVLKEYPDAWVFHPIGSPFQMPGVPDLLICVEGMLAGVEIKNPRPGESPERARARTTERQKFQIRNINRAGGIAGTVISVDEAMDLIDRGLRHRGFRPGIEGEKQ